VSPQRLQCPPDLLPLAWHTVPDFDPPRLAPSPILEDGERVRGGDTVGEEVPRGVSTMQCNALSFVLRTKLGLTRCTAQKQSSLRQVTRLTAEPTPKRGREDTTSKTVASNRREWKAPLCQFPSRRRAQLSSTNKEEVKTKEGSLCSTYTWLGARTRRPQPALRTWIHRLPLVEARLGATRTQPRRRLWRAVRRSGAVTRGSGRSALATWCCKGRGSLIGSHAGAGPREET
jgi:hypothetical protein